MNIEKNSESSPRGEAKLDMTVIRDIVLIWIFRVRDIDI